MRLNRAVLFAFALSAMPGVGIAANEASTGSSGAPTSSGASESSGGASTSGTAEGAGGAKQWSSFTQVDADSSGFIEQSEAASAPGLDFNISDTDSDGRISKSEYEAAMRNSGAGKGAAGKGDGGGGPTGPTGGSGGSSGSRGY